MDREYYEKQVIIGEAKCSCNPMRGYCTSCGQPINNYQVGFTKCGGNYCLDDEGDY